MNVDPIDRMIIGLLRQDGRATKRRLAETLGLPESTVRDRVRALEAGGMIRGYHARVDPSKLGVGLVAWVFVDVSPDQAAHFARFAEEQPAVVRGHTLKDPPSGFALKVAAPNSARLSQTLASWRRSFNVTVLDMLLVDDEPEGSGRPDLEHERLVLGAVSERLGRAEPARAPPPW